MSATLKSQPALCGCGLEPCRPGQRTGLKCHAAAMKKYRRGEKKSALVGLCCMADDRYEVIEVVA